MRFRIYSAPYDDELPAPAGGIGTNWENGDVMITNRGFFLPEVSARPEPDEVYAAIKAGQSGNPVFTDSIYCEGG
jgi:hypothetical protein